MNCRVILFNEKNNKTIKEFIISCESYSLCEDKVKKLNEDIQYPKRYKLTHINI